jgi:hypothetical protein
MARKILLLTLLGGLFLVLAGGTFVAPTSSWAETWLERQALIASGSTLRRQRQQPQSAQAPDAGKSGAKPDVVAAAGPERFSPDNLAGLPAPVARYLGLALHSGQPMLAAVRIDHAGRRSASGSAAAAAAAPASLARWLTFTSTQRLTMRPPFSPWDGAIFSLPDVGAIQVLHHPAARGRALHAGQPGVIGMINDQDEEQYERDALMRYLALAAWYPTALLPSQGVSWQAVNADSACATLEGQRVLSVTLLFHFGADGLIDTVQVPQRSHVMRQHWHRQQAKRADHNSAVPDSSAETDTSQPQPWQVRFWNPVRRDGMQVPQDAELAWLLPDGPRPYWLGRLTRAVYEFAP